MVPKIHSLGGYIHEYQKSITNPEAFWAEVAEGFYWHKRCDQVLEWDFKGPSVKWFSGGKLNITENIFERNLYTIGNQAAIIWEPNDPSESTRILTYSELHREVNKFSNTLKQLGVKKGDRVAIYMPMVPELTIAMLACARIGAVHSVVFAGFSAASLADRINDAEAKVVLTADGGFRGEKITPLKNIVDEALESCTCVETVVVYERTKSKINMIEGRDIWWHNAIENQSDICPAEEMESEDNLFILYTSGSTGKPKGIVHTTAGYMVYTAYTFRNVFQYNAGDVYFCTADIGWVTGHSYIVYGPLLNGAQTLMFEGIPTWPDAGRFWDVVDKHKVNQFYTAPTAIRSLLALGMDHINDKDLSSLKVLGTVGEPINEEAWHWYHDHIGRNRCPIVDTWWQTESGATLISNMAGITPAKAGWATLPMPGVQPILVDENGKEASPVLSNDGTLITKGNLCIKAPWPGILRTTWGDHERCRTNYFATYPNLFFTGDGALKNENGCYRITGRVDDVLNISGHRVGTAEVENAINMHAGVVESAVVGYPHDIKGQSIYAFVIYNGHHGDENLRRQDISMTVSKIIGAIAKPDKIQFVTGLPKTRSGKIMRRILRKIAEGETGNLGDTSTLLDPDLLEEIRAGRL